MRVIDIINGTTVDGPGFRTSIYFAGCRHRCAGCQNPSTWDADAGHVMSVDEIMQIVNENNFNVTFSGGDPLFQVDRIIPLAQSIKDSGKNIWCYTGFTYEQIQSSAHLKQILPYLDVLVDGPFVESMRDIDLLFRGSTNQRLIDVPQTLANAAITLWTSDF